MVLYHELTACYAAGSLGGTLGRLNESLQRLSRAHSTGSREKPGAEAQGRSFAPAGLACLNQTMRLMSDAWKSKVQSSRPLALIEDRLDCLKENALGNIGRSRRIRPGQHSEYQTLAQTLDNLKTSGWEWA